MFFIGKMNFFAFFMPYMRVYRRKESIGLWSLIIYLCKAEFIGQFNGLAVYGLTTDDVDMLFFMAAL